MGTTQIRRATTADAAQLAPFMAECFLAAYSHASDPARIAGYVAQHFTVERLRAELADPHLLTWIVTAADGRWAGFGQLHRQLGPPDCLAGRSSLEIRRFYFAPQFHGAGLAAALMSHAKDAAREAGAESVWLNVWQEAPQAIRFYTKQGFAIVGTATFWVMDDPKMDWVMVSSL